jgi:hypothetical protein
VLDRVTARLRGAGLGPDKTGSIETWLSSDPASLKSLAIALDTPEAPDDSQGPLAQSLWMLVADFLAAAIAIVPFALLPVAQGRVVSATVTLMLLIGLGIGRAWIGGRSVAHGGRDGVDRRRRGAGGRGYRHRDGARFWRMRAFAGQRGASATA